MHHLYVDPGVSAAAKAVHAFLTFIVAVPSFMTAFNIGASLEYRQPQQWRQGLLGCIFKQRWNDPVVASQLVAMLLFLAGGITGLMKPPRRSTSPCTTPRGCRAISTPPWAAR